MEYWRGLAKRPYLECLLPTILAFVMLAISIICLAAAATYHAKLFGTFPVFNNVIVRTGLVQTPSTPTISALNASALPARLGVAATVPSIFVN